MVHALEIVGKIAAGVGFAAAFILLIRWMFPESAPRTRGSAITYAGGFLSKQWTGSWGTVVLVLDDSGATVRGRGPFGVLVNWHAAYSEIPRVRAARSIGVQGLLMQGPYGPIAFWTPRSAEILDLFDLRNVPVDRTVTKIKRKDFNR